MIARGIAGRIALAAIASAAVGLVILAIGVAVVGAAAFTELMMTHLAFCVSDIKRRPVLIAERAPDGMVTIYRDRIVDVQVYSRAPYILDVLLESKLR